MEPPWDFKSLQEDLQKSLVSTVKTVNRLAAEDLPFQRTANPDTAEQLDDHAARLLRLSTRLLHAAANVCRLKPPRLEDAEDFDMRWHSVVDVVDSVLEKADTALDEFTRLIKKREPTTTEPVSRLVNRPPASRHVESDPVLQDPSSKKTKPPAKVVRNANVIKPQTQFQRKPDNFPTGPWKPTISHKPHAILPLDQSFVTFTDESGSLQYAPSLGLHWAPYRHRGKRNKRVLISTCILDTSTHTRRKLPACNTPIDCSKLPSPFLLNP